jgi:uracil-DNA glycosylase
MEDRFPYEGDDVLQQLTSWIAVCRDAGCPVPQRHPFYPIPEQPPLYYGKRPCMPVVPAYLTRGKIMIIGEYPNCRFATFQNERTGELEKYVPVGDINEPFEDGRYFNGYQVQLYPTGKSLRDCYFEPLGLKFEDIWQTNMVKCFLIKSEYVDAYQRLGFTGPEFPPTSATYDDYFQAATPCLRIHLAREIAICQPKLVIGLGERVFRMIHSSDDFSTPAADLVNFGRITGVPLHANVTSHPLDTRNSLFKKLNVIHLYHPSSLLRYENVRKSHFRDDIPQAKKFLEELGLNS